MKAAHPEVADDIWGAVASQTNLELGGRLEKFRTIVETKKKALSSIETDLWNRLAELEVVPAGEVHWPSEHEQEGSAARDEMILNLLKQETSKAPYVTE